MSKGYSWKIVYDKNGIGRLDAPSYWETGSGDECYLDSNVLRNHLDSILEEKMSYSVFQVFINPISQDELSKYVKKFEWMNGVGECNYRKACNKDEYCLDFNQNLKSEYFSVLDSLMELNLGKNSFVNLPTIEESTDGGWPSKSSLLSPHNYIVKNKGDNIDTFLHSARNLNGDVAYSMLKEKEHPQNYNMAQIDFLRNKGISPLVVSDENFEIDVDTLKNVVNFFIPFRIVHKSSSGYDDSY